MFWSRPFVAVAVLLTGGIVAVRYSKVELEWCLAGLGFAAGMVVWRKTRVVGVAAAIFALGMAVYAGRYRVGSADDLRVVLSGEPELVTVRGRLLDSPAVREFQSGAREVAYSYASLEVSEIEHQKQWRPAAGRVVTRTRGELAAGFFQGRTVEVTGVIAFPAKAAAPGLFDYRAYLHNTRIFHQVKSDSTNDWRLLSFESMPLTEQFRRWAEAQLQRGVPARDEASEIIAAMALGLRNTLSGEMRDVFMRTGTMHIIAISGLHVACITGFLCFVLVRIMGLSRAVGGIIVLVLVWFYTAATGLQSSAVRSALMASVFIMGWVLRRPGELLNALAASAVLILVVQPEQLFQASFQLSFSVVLVIALAVMWIAREYPDGTNSLKLRMLRIDPLLPYELAPSWKKAAHVALGFLLGNFLISAASWIGSLPLTAYYFNTVTPVSLLANLVAVPLSSVSLGATVVSILVPPVGPVSNYIAWLFMGWTIQAVELFGAFPLGYFYVPRPNAVFMVAYSLAVAVLFIPALRLGLRKVSSALVVAVLSLFWLGSVYVGQPIARLTVLPCAGTPVFVESAGANDLLIDCSSERDAELMVTRFLRAKGRGSIDRLLLTHGDAQVSGGFPVVWREFRPEVVLTSEVKMRSPGYRKAIGVLEENRARWKTIGAGDEVDGWQVLHPPLEEKGFPRADDNAVVLRRRIGSWTVLHLSELGTAGQARLIESGENLRGDVVIAGMPEQGEPLSAELLDAIQPKVIILGTTEYPYRSQGTPELRKRLEASGATVFYVHENGAVTISVTREECLINSMEGRRVALSSVP